VHFVGLFFVFPHSTFLPQC